MGARTSKAKLSSTLIRIVRRSIGEIEGARPCVIPEAHMRGITLGQLRQLYAFARDRCAEERWEAPAKPEPMPCGFLGRGKHLCPDDASGGLLKVEELAGGEPDPRRPPFARAASLHSLQSSSEGGHAAVTKVSSNRSGGTLSSGSRSSGGRASEDSAIRPGDIDLYTLVAHVIKPVTEPRSCSYVEFASTDPERQVPRFFVSHYWGEMVADFISALALFHMRHGLCEEVPFWVCAYALRQNSITSELGTGDLMQEPFARAVASANVQGIVAILDDALVVYRRAWCCFEAALSIGLEKRFDIVALRSTGTGRMPFMIADGPAQADGDAATQEARDQEFPLQVAEEGMSVTVELATASVRSDRNRILNHIASQAVCNDAPPLFHPNYDFYNEEIRKKFAAVVLRVATSNGDADSVRKALHRCPNSHLLWRSVDGQTQLQVAEALAQKHPGDQARGEIVTYLKQAFASTQRRLKRSNSAGGSAELSAAAAAASSGASARRPSLAEVYGHVKRTSSLPSVATAAKTAPSRAAARRSSLRDIYSHIASSVQPPMLPKSRGRPRAVEKTVPTRRASLSRILLPHRTGQDPGEATAHRPAGGWLRRRSLQVVHAFAEEDLRDTAQGPGRAQTMLAVGELDAGAGATSGWSPDRLRSPRSSTDGSSSTLDSETLGDGADDTDQLVIARITLPRGDIDRLVALIAARPGNTNVQEEACRELGSLAFGSPELQERAAEAGGLEAVIAVLQDSQTSAEAQREACRALWSLLYTNGKNLQRAVGLGALGVARSLLESGSEHAGVMREARLIVGNLESAAETARRVDARRLAANEA